jgi:hypothetical protein
VDVRDALRSANRHRPFIVAVLVAALLVFPLATDHRHDSTRVSGAAGSARAATSARIETTVAGATDGATPRAGATGATAGVARTAVASPLQGSGAGSPEALASPDCDRKTGRIRIPFLFAPLCVRPWPAGADNGGATSMGVTRDAVRVVVYSDASQTAAATAALGATSRAQGQSPEDAWNNAAAMYTATFRTWGRKIQIVFYAGTGSDEVAQRADAIKIATDIKPFAVIDHNSAYLTLYQELASRGVIVLPSADSVKSTLAQQPYRWSMTLAPDELLMQMVAEYAGKRLQGRPAKWSGDPVAATHQRVFGLVSPKSWDTKVLTNELAKYGGKVVDRIDYDPIDIPGQQERSRVAIARLKAAGVTTVLAGSDVLYTPVLTKEATAQQWFPEWVVTSYLGQDLDLFSRLNDQTQWRHAFGVGASVGPASTQPLPQTVFYEWYWGDGTGNASTSGATIDLSALLTGIHLAGPHLTPFTFRDGLFSQPPSGGVSCGCVLYPERSYGRWGVVPWVDYTGFEDVTEVWWDVTAQGPDNAALAPGTGTGKYRYVDGGKRYTLGTWPSTEPKAFDPSGAVAFYDTPPAADRPAGPYPCADCPSKRR